MTLFLVEERQVACQQSSKSAFWSHSLPGAMRHGCRCARAERWCGQRIHRMVGVDGTEGGVLTAFVNAAIGSRDVDSSAEGLPSGNRGRRGPRSTGELELPLMAAAQRGRSDRAAIALRISSRRAGGIARVDRDRFRHASLWLAHHGCPLDLRSTWPLTVMDDTLQTTVVSTSAETTS